MIYTFSRKDLPDWAYEAQLMECPYCGQYLVDNSDTGVSTMKKCINSSCPGHMQYKIKELATYFNIKQIGPATALHLIHTYNLQNHLEILRYWFEEKPVVQLSEVAVLAYLDGYGETKATANLNQYASFEEYFAKASLDEIDDVLYWNKDYLLECEKYFTIKRPLTGKKLAVMLTGVFYGYSNRNDLIKELNDKYGQYVHIIDVGRRKTGVNFLIKEENAVDHSKSQIAKDYGISIVTPMMFKLIVEELAKGEGYVDQ